MTPKELVILAAQFDLVTCRWSVASIDAAGVVDPLVQSAAEDLALCSLGTFDEQTSFLRHRIAGALQRGSDRMWGRRRKSELFAIEFLTADNARDGELIARVAQHFCLWMVKPPVVCLQGEPGQAPSVLVTNAESPDKERIVAGLTNMRALTPEAQRWELLPEAAPECESS